MSDHQKQLDVAKIQMMTYGDTAFISTVCFSMQHIWDDSIPTACTNGTYIKYNTKFWLSLDPDEQLFVLLHETWHVAFAHMGRLMDRGPRKWNIAADYVINYMLVSRGYKIPKGGLYDPQYADMSTEEVYDLLPENPKSELPMEDLVPSGDTPDEIEEAQSRLDDILVRASMQSSMHTDGAGMMPGEVELYINSLLAPKLPWTRILQKYVAKVIKSGRSFRRPNRRYFPKHILPTRYSEGLCDIAIAGDISGSVSDEVFRQYLSEAYYVLSKCKPNSLTFMQFDTTIKQVDEIDSPEALKNVKLHGRGGTDINPVIRWVAENKPSLTIILTDGQFYLQEPNPGVPVIWAISDNTNFDPAYGRVIHLKT